MVPARGCKATGASRGREYSIRRSSKEMRLRLLLVLAAACAHAQVPPPSPPPATPAFGVIEGQVFDASTGLPIGGATVIARKIEQVPAGGQSAGQPQDAAQQKPKAPLNGATDENGAFALVGLEPGEYRLMAVHEGYVLTEF